MFFKFTKIFVVLIISALAGCSTGRQFVRSDTVNLRVGESSYSQVIAKMGEPYKSSEGVKNSVKIKSLVYAFSENKPLNVVSLGYEPQRFINFLFDGDTLVGQQFVSSFKEDSTNFDENKIAGFIKAKTTRSDIISILGNPSGNYIKPMINDTSREAIGYKYITYIPPAAFQPSKTYTKTLTISFDDNDRVLNIDYSSSGDPKLWGQQ